MSSDAGSAAWFYNCSWRHASQPSGVPAANKVSVDNRNCRVYTNTQLLTVWDKQLRREMSAWQLTPVPDPSPGNEDVFAAVEGSGQRAFLRPDDPLFVKLLKERASATGVQVAVVPELPAGTEFIVNDPYAEIDKDEFHWTGRQLLLMLTCAGFVMLLLGLFSAVMWLMRRSTSSAEVCSSLHFTLCMCIQICSFGCGFRGALCLFES